MPQYDASQNRWVRGEDLTLRASAASDGETDAVGSEFVTGPGILAATLDVTDDTGTSVDVTIETREDAAAAWREVAAFTQATAVGSERKTFEVDNRVRVKWTTVGAMTFSVAGVVA